MLDYNEEWAQETKRMIDNEGGVSEVIQTDVTNEDSCRNAVQQATSLFGSITILVNIVGVGGAMGDATAVDMLAWERDLRINVTSMVLMSRHVIPEMRKNGRGAIVNMSSVSGLLGGKHPHKRLTAFSRRYGDSVVTYVVVGNPSLLYPTTKGAIIQMTRAMAAQHGPENIR